MTMSNGAAANRKSLKSSLKKPLIDPRENNGDGAIESDGSLIVGVGSKAGSSSASSKLVANWADEATSDGEEVDRDFMHRRGDAIGQWQIASGASAKDVSTVEFLPHRAGDKIASSVPIGPAGIGKEECEIMSHRCVQRDANRQQIGENKTAGKKVTFEQTQTGRCGSECAHSSVASFCSKVTLCNSD
jgi:hypothetical protein